jgi:endonuclease/exonuclease/phosphatase family metal-dependent hydrolase
MPRFKLFALAACVAALAAPAAWAEQPHPFAGDRQVTVMTQNLYLGADLRPIFAAPSFPAALAAAGAAWAQVQANDFPSRAETIADEIAAAHPDLVGLQEATHYLTDVPADGPATPAQTEAYDFERILLAKLAARGESYELVASFTGTDVEIPAGLPPRLDVHFTDRVAVLARADEKTADLKLTDARTSTFPTTLTLPTVLGPIAAPRGWASVDVKIRGKSFRFVTTHLEAFSPFVRNPQAVELLAGPLATDLPVVVVGDFNSGPGMDLGAYGILTAGGLTDAWADGPATCCHAVDLHDPNPTLTKRIDLVLTRGGFRTIDASVVDGRVNGLWASDHAGVVATLALPETGNS